MGARAIAFDPSAREYAGTSPSYDDGEGMKTYRRFFAFPA